MSRVSNDIEREIAAAMRDCIGENEAVLEKRAADAGKEAVKRLKAESRKRSGKYAKGWTSTVDHASLEQGVEVTVHNKQYRLTHLCSSDLSRTRPARPTVLRRVTVLLQPWPKRWGASSRRAVMRRDNA